MEHEKSIGSGRPAFPSVKKVELTIDGESAGLVPVTQPGMSMREWIATMALQSKFGKYSGLSPEDRKEMASDCYLMADAMLAESEKRGS